MTLLVCGILVFCLVHLFPAALPSVRDRLHRKLGENPYRGLFSLVIIVSLVVIVFGWKAAVPRTIYEAPLAANIFTSLLILVGFVLFFASQFKGNIKRFIRHPQMVGTILWGIAHLLTNGDSRSVTLFGGMAIWALFEIVMINRQEGPRGDVEVAAAKFDLIAVAVGAVVFALVGHFHLKLFGVAPIPV